MTELTAIPAGPLTGLVALNNAFATETSPLTVEEFELLRRVSFSAIMAGGLELPDALLLAMDEGSDYQGLNFQWFQARYDRFVYVDRVIVAQAAQGRGLARKLYEQLFREVAASGRGLVTCEVNAVPPNPASDAFHARLGFELVGTGSPHPGKKVSYLARQVG